MPVAGETTTTLRGVWSRFYMNYIMQTGRYVKYQMKNFIKIFLSPPKSAFSARNFTRFPARNFTRFHARNFSRLPRPQFQSPCAPAE